MPILTPNVDFCAGQIAHTWHLNDLAVSKLWIPWAVSIRGTKSVDGETVHKNHAKGGRPGLSKRTYVLSERDPFMATASTASEAAHLLATRSKEELARGMASLAHKMHGFIESKKAPLLQLAHTGAGLGGGVVSGVIRTFLPELWGIPVDGTIGVLTSLFCLAGAGDNLVDAVAEFGVGLAAPAFSRGTENIMRTWLAAPKAGAATAKAA